MTPSAARNRARTATRRAGSIPANGPADIFPVDVRRSSGSKRRDDLWRWSRLIITDDALYVATSKNKGMDVEAVTKYPLPDGERKATAHNKGSWGQFSWSGCGCANSWDRHAKDSLIKLADA
jgi:hypothetical protein